MRSRTGATASASSRRSICGSALSSGIWVRSGRTEPPCRAGGSRRSARASLDGERWSEPRVGTGVSPVSRRCSSLLRCSHQPERGSSQMFTSKQIAIGLVAAAGLTAGASAYAVTSQQAPQKHQLRALGLGVMSVTPATREARVIVQCGDGRGRARHGQARAPREPREAHPGCDGRRRRAHARQPRRQGDAGGSRDVRGHQPGGRRGVRDRHDAGRPARSAGDATGRDAGREHAERRSALLRGDHRRAARDDTPGRRGRRGPGRSSARPSATTSAPSRSTSTRSTCPPGT